MIEKITYPTGGEEKFVHSAVAPLTRGDSGNVTDQTNLGVVNRKLYPIAGQGIPIEWIYSASYVPPTGYKVSIISPDQTLSEKFLHQGYPPCANCSFGDFGFDNGLAGMPYEERGYDSSNPRKLLSQRVINWTKKTFSPYPVGAADWHPRTTQEESRIYDSAGNGVSTTTTLEYEGDLELRETPVLVKKSAQYAFVPVGSALPSNPVRSSENTFLINDPTLPPPLRMAYTNQNMIGLVTVSVIRDGAGLTVSRTEMVYDESGSSPGQRGFVTTLKVWDSTRGASTVPGAYILTHAKFDYPGNQIETTDANGNVSTTEYTDNYSDGINRGSLAFPTKTISAIPGGNGSATAFETTIKYDFTTGLPVSTTDANGLTTAIEYDSATLRPRFTRTYINCPAACLQVGATTETVYNDTASNVWVKNRSQIDASNWAETTTRFDGMGRAYETEELNSAGNIFVNKKFDAQGRVEKVSNPYLKLSTDACYVNNQPSCWTTNVYDNASRVTSVTLPDGATVGTEYGVSTSAPVGVTKQITDQAQKKRKGFTDALGNMVRVIEDPTGQNLSTDYVFDVLGNLRKTTQGVQTRFFMHDSLGRLLFAKQPEQDVNANLVGTDAVTGNTQWSAKYVYDANGNITSTTDARNQTITAQYDRLNRLQVRDYVTDTLTPDVQFFYDGMGLGLPTPPAYSKGKTTKVSTSVSATEYNLFDEFGRVKRSKQITDGVTYGDDTNPMTYDYNLSGALTEQKYPSGRVVKTILDANGDLSQVQTKKNAAGTFLTYAGSFSYNAAGAIKKMQLGNGRWETFKYNDRQQITQIGLGTTDTDIDPDLLRLEFSYGTSAQNNGSMREQKITVPTVGSNPGFTAIQTYTYDNLNRIESARETVGGSQTWKQTFIIDRYGNRKYDAANTTTISSCASAVCNPTFPSDSTNRNRFTDGQGYFYDANGNVTQDAIGQRFHYDSENHQKAFFATGNGGSTPDWTYSYDGDGRRVKKASATEATVFVYDATGKLVAEYSSALAPVQQVSYLTADHLGSPRITTNQTGAVTNRKDFMAYGEEALSPHRVPGPNGNKYEPSSPTRKDYTGYEKDLESGLEFAQARYYNPTHGRFTSVDPLTASASIKNPQSFNRYSYVLNSPYKFSDPLGLLPQGFGGGGGFCSASASSCSSGESLTTRSEDEYKRPQAAPPPPPPPPGCGFSQFCRDRRNPNPRAGTNPTYPGAPVPGTAYFDTPSFNSLNKPDNVFTTAAYNLLIGTSFGSVARAAVLYSKFTTWEQGVFLNTVSAIAARSTTLLAGAFFEGFYNGQDSYSRNSGPLAFGIVLSGISGADLTHADMGTSLLHGRRSPGRDETASLEASPSGVNRWAFDVDLYNSKSRGADHLFGEVRFNKSRGVTTHVADVARALFARRIDSGVITR